MGKRCFLPSGGCAIAQERGLSCWASLGFRPQASLVRGACFACLQYLLLQVSFPMVSQASLFTGSFGSRAHAPKTTGPISKLNLQTLTSPGSGPHIVNYHAAGPRPTATCWLAGGAGHDKLTSGEQLGQGGQCWA